jgi:hypothetical protein
MSMPAQLTSIIDFRDFISKSLSVRPGRFSLSYRGERPTAAGVERIRLTARNHACKIAGGGSRKGSKGNAVRVHLVHATPRLPPQL